MAKEKLATSKDGQPMHFSVGALIEKDGKYLLIDRTKPPFGFAGPAGHIDEGETAEKTLVREVLEETGLKVEKYKLLFSEEVSFGTCSRGVSVHYFHLFRCNTTGQVKRDNIEAKSIGWYTIDEIKKMPLEPVWNYWFKKLNLI